MVETSSSSFRITPVLCWPSANAKASLSAVLAAALSFNESFTCARSTKPLTSPSLSSSSRHSVKAALALSSESCVRPMTSSTEPRQCWASASNGFLFNLMEIPAASCARRQDLSQSSRNSRSSFGPSRSRERQAKFTSMATKIILAVSSISSLARQIFTASSATWEAARESPSSMRMRARDCFTEARRRSSPKPSNKASACLADREADE
mmetsp:Transcript_51662/g.93093  ORF Transcript_51662/g.93093 Transcript_51662/m.93093 type:complete len:209 (+) Transcript_51662:369-995(+)